MMFAAAVGHRSGRATPSLRDAPQRQSIETIGRETIYRDRNAVQTNPATSLLRPRAGLSASCIASRNQNERSPPPAHAGGAGGFMAYPGI
jgi:hypothetical protein